MKIFINPSLNWLPFISILVAFGIPQGPLSASEDYETWGARVFGTDFGSPETAPEEDFTKDGIRNLMAYGAGLDPIVRNSIEDLYTATFLEVESQSFFSLSFQRSKTAQGLIIIESSVDVFDWQKAVFTTQELIGEDEAIEEWRVTVPTEDEDQLFLRLKSDPDTDSDGFIDGLEVVAGTDPLNDQSFPQRIAYGETLAGQINPADERDAFGFDAAIGDEVLVRMSSLTTFFGATFRVYRPDGSILCSKIRGNKGLIEDTCIIDAAGLHAIVLSDDAGTEDGNYNVAIQKLNGPGNTTPIAYGETVAGTITPDGELDTFVFNAALGDEVLVRMSSLTTFFGATFRVYRPDGSLLCSKTRGNKGLIEDTCIIDAAGLHAIVLSDDAGTEDGNYNVAIQKLNGPGNTTPIAYGETVAGTITTAGELDTFVFNAALGDEVLVRMSSLTTFFGATFRVYRPDGSLLCSKTRGNEGLIEETCIIDAAGLHAIVLSDDAGTEDGNYNVAIQKLNGPGNTTPIAYGETVAGTITTAGELDTFVFNAALGDEVLVRMSSLTTFFGATFRVYRPDGSLLCSETRGNEGLIEETCIIDAAGLHAIVLSDDAGTRVGNYNVAIQKLNGPGNTTPIAYGETVAGTITTDGELDTFVFNAALGDEVLVRMSSLTTFFGATFRVYRPDGSLLCSETRGNEGLIEETCIIDVEGNHAIVLSDDAGTEVGNYELTLELQGPL